MKYLQTVLLFLILSVIGNVSQSGEKVTKESLIKEVKAYQLRARNKAIHVECIADARWFENGQLIQFRKPARFLYDHIRVFSSVYLAGQDDRGLVISKHEFGYDGKRSVNVVYDGERARSATSDCKEPKNFQVLDPNICGGVCVAYGSYLAAKRWLKTQEDETFLEAFIRQCDTIDSQKDAQSDEEITASLKRGSTTYYLVFKTRPEVHCVQFRSEHAKADQTNIETIGMKYKYVDGNWAVVGTSRTVLSRTKSTSGEAISNLKGAFPFCVT